MKKETIIKILNRYRKGLIFMSTEADSSSEAEHYRVDANAMKQAIELIERSNT